MVWGTKCSQRAQRRRTRRRRRGRRNCESAEEAGDKVTLDQRGISGAAVRPLGGAT